VRSNYPLEARTRRMGYPSIRSGDRAEKPALSTLHLSPASHLLQGRNSSQAFESRIGPTLGKLYLHEITGSIR
jgi:hypothetical protein